MPSEPSSAPSVQTHTGKEPAEESDSDLMEWWRRIDHRWIPSPVTIRVVCGLFAAAMLMITLFRHRPGDTAVVAGRVFFIAYGFLGLLLAERLSTAAIRIYLMLLAITLPLHALYASLTASSAPDTLGFIALAILFPLVFLVAVSDLLVAVVVLIAGHGVFMARFPEPTIGLANHWTLWLTTILLGTGVSLSLLVYRGQLSRSERALADARDAAEAASRATSDLMANMSDEIRTPMNGITGLIDVVLDTEMTEEQRHYLSMVKSDADRLTSLLNDLLDLSKMHAHRLELEIETFNLLDLLRATLTPLALHAEEKKLSLAWETSYKLPVWVRGDPRRLRQILVNLVHYTMDFTQAGHVSVKVSRLTSRQQREFVEFQVRDTRSGMSEERLQDVRKALSQPDAPSASDFGRSSLGLAICSQLVCMMDGSIAVSGEPGKNSTFSFTAHLPTDADKEREWANKSSRGKQGSSFVVDVLVVEDNPTNRVFAERVLQKAGHRVVTAQNGQEALERLAERDFDIVFMDMNMPVMDGLQAARKIRENEQSTGFHLPIVALTAHVLEEQRQQCLDAGMDMHLGKPVHGSDLLDAIYHLVDSAGLQSSAPKIGADTAPDQSEERVTAPQRSVAKAQASGSKAPRAESAEGDVSVFAFERLLDMLGGDRELISDMLSEFVVQRVEIANELREALQASDADRCAKLAHKLKGSLLALCTDASAHVARDLELCMRDGDIERGRQLFAVLEQKLDELDVELQSMGLIPR